MASEINPNVDLTTAQPTNTEKNGAVELGAGEISFDALEGAGVAPQPANKRSSKTAETSADAGLGNAKEVSEGEGAEAAPTKEAKATTAAPESKATPEVAPKAEEGPKSVKFKTVAGREVEIPLDSKITKKIDGVDQEVSIKEALDQYAGKVAYDKRFTELDQRDKAYIADKQQTESQLTGILQKAYNKDVMGSILEMSKIAGLDPAPVFESLKQELIGNIEQFMQMTPEQRDLHFMKKENDFLKRSKASEDEERTKKQAQTELDGQLSSLRETLNIADEDLKKAESTIRSNPETYKSFDNPKGKIELADALKRWELASTALGLIDTDYAQDQDMVEVAARKLQGFKGSAEEAAKAIAQRMKLTARGPQAQVLDNLSKKVEQTKKVLGQSSAKEPELTPVSKDDAFDPRGWDSI